MNYATVGDASKPALLLIPGQTESWWGYESALPLLAEHFQAYAVDLRGQGRSTRTPGRYTLDNMGNDLVRFIDTGHRAAHLRQRPLVRRRPVGLALRLRQARARSSPPTTRTRRCSPPRSTPPPGQGIRQGIGSTFHLWSTYLGDQWSIGDWDGMRAAAPDDPPAVDGQPHDPAGRAAADPQGVRPRVGPRVLDRHRRGVLRPRAHAPRRQGARCCSPTTSAVVDEQGLLMGALSDVQAARVRELLGEAGVPVDYRSFETMGHSMHGQDPQLFTDTLVDWVAKLAG